MFSLDKWVYLTKAFIIYPIRNVLRSDSVDFEFLFKKPKRLKLDTKPDEYKEWLTSNDTRVTVWGVDPGATDMFTASDGCYTDIPHRIRSTSTKEYYDLCGFNVATERRKRWKDAASENINKIIDEIPTIKSANYSTLVTGTLYRMYNWQTIINFYDQDLRFNVQKLKSYKGRQKGINEIARRLTFGSKKYARDPDAMEYELTDPAQSTKWKPKLSCDKSYETKDHNYIIAYGKATWGNLAGKLPAPTKRLVNELRKITRRRGCRVSLCMIDEYNTSKVCANCHEKAVENVAERRSVSNNHKERIHAVLKCKNCSTTWNRDVMAARNMRYVFLYQAQHGGERPMPFKRPATATTTTNNVGDFIGRDAIVNI